MTEYVWQLGIDWNAIQTGGVGYLRGALTTAAGAGLPGTEEVKKDDTITFRIFDVTTTVHGRHVAEIVSFGIDSQVAVNQAAVNGQSDEPSLDNTHPAIGLPNESTLVLQTSLFGSAYCSWDSGPVTVAATSGRFLLTVYLQARGTDGVVRLFNHDPEMVVGPFG
jgi:hypothetical protein